MEIQSNGHCLLSIILTQKTPRALFESIHKIFVSFKLNLVSPNFVYPTFCLSVSSSNEIYTHFTGVCSPIETPFTPRNPGSGRQPVVHGRPLCCLPCSMTVAAKKHALMKWLHRDLPKTTKFIKQC